MQIFIIKLNLLKKSLDAVFFPNKYTSWNQILP